MNFEPINTQEAFDEKVKELLEENTKTVTESITSEFTSKYKDYISPEELKEKMGTLSAENKAYSDKLKKFQIAYELGIPLELSEKISGGTDEEMRADAEKIMSFLSSAKASPKFSAEIPLENTQKSALLSMLHKLNNK